MFSKKHDNIKISNINVLQKLQTFFLKLEKLLSTLYNPKNNRNGPSHRLLQST